MADAGISVVIVAGFGTTGALGVMWLLMILKSCTKWKIGLPSRFNCGFWTGKKPRGVTGRGTPVENSLLYKCFNEFSDRFNCLSLDFILGNAGRRLFLYLDFNSSCPI